MVFECAVTREVMTLDGLKELKWPDLFCCRKCRISIDAQGKPFGISGIDLQIMRKRYVHSKKG